MAKDQSGFNGEKCSVKDHYDRHALDHHSQRMIREVIQSPDFNKGGWEVAIVGYEILQAGPFKIDGPDHTNIQLLRPKDSRQNAIDQNGRMVNSIDLWSMDQKDGSGTFYADEGRFTAVLDDCKPDNLVVQDHKETRRATVLSGTGPEVLKSFLVMAEAAGRANDARLTYQKFPDVENGGYNSNTLPHAVILASGHVYPESFARLSGGNKFSDDIPGKDRGPLLRDLLMKEGELYFAGIPAADIVNVKHRDRMAQVLDGLKMEAQQAQICRDAKNEAGCVVPVPAAP